MVGLSPTRGSRGRLIVLAALQLLVLNSCLEAGRSAQPVDDPGEAVGGTPTEAASIVEQWLERASTGIDDRGWSLLFPNIRTDLIGSEEVYRDALPAADWSGFQYTIGAVATEDGEYRVRVRVQGGAKSVPAPIRDWGLIQFVSTDGVESDEGFITVRIDPSGWPWGIQATG